MRSLFITLAFSLIAIVATATPKDVVVEEGAKYTIHKIEKGETLYSLAKQYGVTLEELKAANDGLSDNVKVGQKIKIPAKATVTEEPKQETPATQQEEPKQTEVKAEEPKQAEAKAETEAAAQQTAVESEKEPEQKPDSMTTLVGYSLSLLEQFLLKGPETFEKLTVVEKPQLPFRRLRRGERARVVLMLPLGSESQPALRYGDFYRGFVMGLDSVRMSGRSVDLHVYNTARDSVRIAEIIASGELEKANLILGPVYDDELAPVLAAMEGKGIPVVSPLSVHKNLNSNVLFQMAPSNEARFNKLREALDSSKRVIVISTNKVDKKFDSSIRELLKGYSNVIEKKYYHEPGVTISSGAAELSALLRGGKAVVFVTSNNEYEVDRIVNRLYAIKQSLSNRSNNGEPFTIIGNSSWLRFSNMDKAIFHSARVKVLTSYNSNREDRANRMFERQYIRTYSLMPSLYAYRGYDAALLFVRALYDRSIEDKLAGLSFMPLSTPYKFEKNEKTGVHANTEWVMLRYNNDSTVTIE